MSLTDNKTTLISPITIQGRTIQAVGSIAALYPNENSLAPANTTHVIPHSVAQDPIPITTYLENLKIMYANKPLIPAADDSELLFRTATITLSYNATYAKALGFTINPSTDLAIFDLVSGQPLDEAVYKSDTSGGYFEVQIQAGKGSWGQAWGGGGSYVLGLTK